MVRPGDILRGKYRLISLLGEGGMGEVFLAEHLGLGGQVAVKVLRQERVDDDEAVARFHREAAAASSITHPGVVDVHDIGTTEDGAPFLVMEYLEGRSLREHLELVGRMDQGTAASVACQVLSALEAAHRCGVVHRDLKPDNIFLEEVEQETYDVKLLDFGISVSTDRPPRGGAPEAIRGTPCYMSPEQARGQSSADHRVDLYAVGAIVYECLTGEPPITGKSYNNVIIKLLGEPLRPPSELVAGLDARLEGVLLKALSKDAEARQGSASELMTELLPFVGERQAGHLCLPSRGPAAGRAPSLDGGARRSRRGRWGLLVISAVLLAIAAGVAGARRLTPDADGVTERSQRSPAEPVEARQASAASASVVEARRPSRGALGDVALRVDLTPRTARLFIDDTLVLDNPFSGRFARDDRPHDIRAEADGFETMEVVVTFDRDRELSLELIPVEVRSRLRPRAGRAGGARRQAQGAPPQPRAEGDDEDPWLGD